MSTVHQHDDPNHLGLWMIRSRTRRRRRQAGRAAWRAGPGPPPPSRSICLVPKRSRENLSRDSGRRTCLRSHSSRRDACCTEVGRRRRALVRCPLCPCVSAGASVLQLPHVLRAYGPATWPGGGRRVGQPNCRRHCRRFFLHRTRPQSTHVERGPPPPARPASRSTLAGRRQKAFRSEQRRAVSTSLARTATF